MVRKLRCKNNIDKYMKAGIRYANFGDKKEEQGYPIKGEINYLKSKEYFEKIIALDTGHKSIDTYMNLGNVYLRIGIINTSQDQEECKKNYLESINNFEKVIALDPYSKNIEAHTGLGLAYSNLGIINASQDQEEGKKNYLESINHSEKAIALDYDSNNIISHISLGNAYLNLGVIYIEQGYPIKGEVNYLSSINHSEQVIALGSEFNDINVYINLGLAYLNLGVIDVEKGENYFLKSKEYFEKVITLYPESKNIEVYINLGIIYGNLGCIFLNQKNLKAARNKFLKSKEYFEKVITLYPSSKNAEVYINLGIIHEKLEDISISKEKITYSESIKKYEKLIDLKENLKEPLFYLGNLLIKCLKIEKDRDKQINYLDKFIKNGCYILIDNLKKIEELDPEIQVRLEKKVKSDFPKKFKNKVEELKIEFQNKINNLEKEKENKKYYMYKTIDKRLIGDLNEKRMWKGKPEYFNDPFDPYYKKFSTILNKELNQIRISCFTENYDNLLMWAHYGDNHKGVCFGYKLKDIYIDELTFFKKVIYEELKTNIKTNGSAKFVVEIKEELLTISEVYLRKHKDWEYEKEWRLINLDYKEDYYYNMKISEVYFGIDCSKEDKNLIKSIIKNNDKYKDDKIEFYEMIQGKDLSVKIKGK